MNATRRRAADAGGSDGEDELAARFDRGDDILSDDDEIVEVVFKKPLDHVIPVRLAAESWRSLRREAVELGVGPTTLARMWLLERLRAVEAGRRGSVVLGETKAPYASSKPRPRRVTKSSRTSASAKKDRKKEGR